jgi:hypothetical protein
VVRPRGEAKTPHRSAKTGRRDEQPQRRTVPPPATTLNKAATFHRRRVRPTDYSSGRAAVSALPTKRYQLPMIPAFAPRTQPRPGWCTGPDTELPQTAAACAWRPRRANSCSGAEGSMKRQRLWICGLTFELSGRHRIGAWPAKRMMTLAGSRAKCQAGGGPLERRVRPHLVLHG